MEPPNPQPDTISRLLGPPIIAACTQEIAASGDEKIFEMFWEPLQSQFTSETTDQARAEMNKDDPGGFSGSLVWNTRYLEVTASGNQWTPHDSVITGILRRWDTATKTLLALRVEHLRPFLGLNP